MNARELHECASQLFMEIRGLSAPEQAARLQRIDAEAPSLAEEVRSLLAHDVHDDAATLPTSVAPESSFSTGIPQLPASIGPYTIVGRLGRGGSGYVLLGEQLRPVRRFVAIKIVPSAAVSPETAARFDFERRALERAEHPNIARILDAGVTPDGLPYLVMDYVEGEPITQYCNERQLSTTDRISIVIDVANAVQHAHMRGVIHRDLKPANILVGEVGGRPVPRVLDFGIAKVTVDTLDDHSPPTLGMALGTPAYMAPEQTGGQTVDTRADVYALGAVLYELVSGRPPIRVDSSADGRKDLADLFQKLRDEIPAPASRARLPANVSTPTESVSRSFRTDLDCILARALEKSPDRRYPTVSALADDLGRLLRYEPVSAQRSTFAYRAARFCQRRRAVVASLALVALALVVGIAGLSIGLIEANRQRQEAILQADAQRELNRFLTDDLLGAASPEQEGENITALELLTRASRKVDKRLGDRPLIAAAVHHALGNAFMELGAFADASRHVEQAVKLRRQHAGKDAASTVLSEISSASLLTRLQRLPDAETALIEVIARARVILGADSSALYGAINDLGTVYISMDRGEQAVAALTEALDGRIRVLGPHDPQVLVTTANLAQAFDRLGQTERSLAMQIEALRIADSFEEPPKMTLIGLCNNIGATYQDLDRDKEAAPYLNRAAQLAATWLGSENPATLMIKSNLAGLETSLGDPARGAELYREVVDTLIRTVGTDAIDTFTARYGYYNARRFGGHPAEACDGFTALLQDLSRVLGADHWLVFQTREALARSLFEDKRRDAALEHARAAAAGLLHLYGPKHERTRSAEDLVRQIEAAPAGKP